MERVQMVKRAALQFAVAGILIPVFLIGLRAALPESFLKIGGFSLSYWALQALIMLAPMTPFVMTPSTAAGDWVLPYAILCASNATIYAGLGALSTILIHTVGWYVVLVTGVLLLMLLLTEEWFLIRWLLGANSPDQLYSLSGALSAMNLRYFVVVAIIVVFVFAWRFHVLRRR